MLAPFSSLAAVLLALPLVSAHGMIISHFIRGARDKSAEVCGSDFNFDRLGKADGNNEFGPISPNSLRDSKKLWKEPEVCNWRLCSGNQYEDNVKNTYYYPAGAVVPINVFILNRHGGVANVSIVDAKTNEVVGAPLIEWTDGKYGEFDHVNTCPNSPPEEQTTFNVTIPDLGDKCTKGGDCVVQWYWYSEAANNQTFNSCIDFVQPFGGSPLPPMVEGRPDLEKHHAYCSPVKTTLVYDTATLLNEASSPKTLVSAGREGNTPAPTTTPTGTASDTIATSTGSAAASMSAAPGLNIQASAAASASASDSAQGSDVAAAPTMTAAAGAMESAPVESNVASEPASPSTTPADGPASPMTTIAAVQASAPASDAESATSTADITSVEVAAASAAATSAGTKSDPVCRIRPKKSAAPVMTTLQALVAAAAAPTAEAGDARTVTVTTTATTTATDNAPALATTTVIEKVYVFMEAYSTSTAEPAAPTARKRHAARRRLSTHH